MLLNDLWPGFQASSGFVSDSWAFLFGCEYQCNATDCLDSVAEMTYSDLSSITLLSSLNAPLHPMPQIRRVSHWHCALYKFTYLFTYCVECEVELNYLFLQLIYIAVWPWVTLKRPKVIHILCFLSPSVCVFAECPSSVANVCKSLKHRSSSCAVRWRNSRRCWRSRNRPTSRWRNWTRK